MSVKLDLVLDILDRAGSFGDMAWRVTARAGDMLF